MFVFFNNQSDDKAEPQGPEATAFVLGCKSLYRSVSLMRKKNIWKQSDNTTSMKW